MYCNKAWDWKKKSGLRVTDSYSKRHFRATSSSQTSCLLFVFSTHLIDLCVPAQLDSIALYYFLSSSPSLLLIPSLSHFSASHFLHLSLSILSLSLWWQCPAVMKQGQKSEIHLNTDATLWGAIHTFCSTRPCTPHTDCWMDGCGTFICSAFIAYCVAHPLAPISVFSQRPPKI